MDQIKKVPKVLSRVQEIPSSIKTAQEIQKFKKQVNSYLSDLKSQFSTIISRYQNEISHLQMESKMLKSKMIVQQTNKFSSPKRSQSTNMDRATYKSQTSSPIKNFYGTSPFNFYQTTSSQMMPWGETGQIKNISPRRTNQKNYHNRHKESTSFPEQLINPEFQIDDRLQKSRFQRASQKKRQKEEELVHCLQMNTKNLAYTTQKLLGLIGKAKKIQSEDDQNGKEGDKNSQKSSKEKDPDQKLNQSLGNICDSLDKSFVSKRARKTKQKQKKAEEQSKKKNKQRDQKNQKMRKQRGLKNLLERLRQNANSTQAPQVVKNSKLLLTGDASPRRNISDVLRKNSKVLINPVPLIQNNNNSPRRRSQSPNQRKPTSILKQSSNILTRSISGISAISFVE